MTLADKIKGLSTRGEACDLASDLHDIEQNCEGTLEECFISGWVNAMDMLDAGTIDYNDDLTFLRYATSETDNMYSVRPTILHKV